ncbi:MAG: hypothetical protein AAF517_23050, partial [Planctomycetota bacterium]
GMSPRRRTVGTRVREVELSAPLPNPKDSQVKVSFDIGSKSKRMFQMGCRFRVNKTMARPGAPYELRCRFPKVLQTGTPANVEVTLTRVKPTKSSQALIRVGLPGGCVVDTEAMRNCARDEKVTHWELKDGYVDLYLRGDPGERRSFSIPVLPVVEGNFVARPSIAYPYYATNKECYASPLRVKIRKTFGATLDPNG